MPLTFKDPLSRFLSTYLPVGLAYQKIAEPLKIQNKQFRPTRQHSSIEHIRNFSVLLHAAYQHHTRTA